jgi:hypothetical protein
LNIQHIAIPVWIKEKCTDGEEKILLQNKLADPLNLNKLISYISDSLTGSHDPHLIQMCHGKVRRTEETFTIFFLKVHLHAGFLRWLCGLISHKNGIFWLTKPKGQLKKPACKCTFKMGKLS